VSGSEMAFSEVGRRSHKDGSVVMKILLRNRNRYIYISAVILVCHKERQSTSES